MDRPILLLRLRRGVVGESRRVVHVVPWPDCDGVPDVLIAYCGEEIRQGTAEALAKLGGMPCEDCLIKAPLPAGMERRPASAAPPIEG